MENSAVATADASTKTDAVIRALTALTDLTKRAVHRLSRHVVDPTSSSAAVESASANHAIATDGSTAATHLTKNLVVSGVFSLKNFFFV